MNGNMKLWLGIIGIVTGILFGGVGAGMIASDKYEELDGKFEAYMANEFQEKVREEHRLTKIEEAITRTNELLEEIKEELRKD